MLTSYNIQSGHNLLTAYNNGEVDSSLQLAADLDLQKRIGIRRTAAVNLFTEYARRVCVSEQSCFEPTLMVVVGGVAAGKSTYIRGLSDDWYKPGGYSDFIPEYKAFATFGEIIKAKRDTERGNTLWSHASYFIREERMLLKARAVQIAAESACSVAIESHPYLDEIRTLVDAAAQTGMRPRIVGVFPSAERDVIGDAARRTISSLGQISIERIRATHDAMDRNWPAIASLADSQVISTDGLSDDGEQGRQG